jgi:CRP-like cAMP-binding protein
MRPEREDSHKVSLSTGFNLFFDRNSEKHHYPPGVELFSQGDDCSAVYFLFSGLVKLFRSEANGHRILVDLKFAGSLVGSAAAISRVRHPTTAITGTGCEIYRWQSCDFTSKLVADASLTMRVSQMLSGDVLEGIARISQLTCLPARQRLECFLWQLCGRTESQEKLDEGKDAAKFQLPLKHYEIAELLCVTPTYLCRLLNVLETDNLIARRGGWILVTKPSALWHVGL